MTTLIDSQANDHDQAAAWIARLRAPGAGASDYEAFALWLARSQARHDAFDEMSVLWADLAVARALPLSPLPARPRRSWLPRRPVWQWGGLAAAACALVLAVMLTVVNRGDGDGELRLHTELGAQQQVELADGSQVQLNTNTDLTVRLSTAHRKLAIGLGEAFFQVAKNPERPFEVACGPTRTVALGTAFNVRCAENSTEVTVTEGVVRVGLDSDRDAPIVRAGEHIVLAHDTGKHVVDPGTERALAWREWKLEFDNTALVDVVAELQRYTATSIRVTDSNISRLRVSGVFSVRDPDLVIKALEESLPIEARQQAGGQILLMPAKG